jgi:dTDP-4-dehydrorhamnose reductase
MDILLLGPNGQLGWELRRSLAPLGRLHAWDRRCRESAAFGDLAAPQSLAAAVRALRPDVVVNAAAFTAVDEAERAEPLAATVNADAPAALAAAMQEVGGLLLHYSTDYVFDGSGDQPRDEAAPTGPLSAYGRTKLAGEQAIRVSGCRHLILRTSWVHAARGGNFARTMLRLAAERDHLRVVDDQVGAPTGADLLADLSAHALRAVLRDPALAGTYHACAAGEVSWCGYARHVIGWAKARGLALRASADDVEAIASRDFPTPARRPLNSRLDTRRLREAFGLCLPDWRDGVDRMLAEALQLPLDIDR